MKKIIFLLGLLLAGLSSQAQNNTSEQIELSKDKYIPITDDQFNNIEDLLNKQAVFIPIIIKDVPRDQLIKFYIQSYNDEIISTWMDFAYKKMTIAKLVEVGSLRDKQFKEFMKLEQNKVNMFKFMSYMTDEQIVSVEF